MFTLKLSEKTIAGGAADESAAITQCVERYGAGGTIASGMLTSVWLRRVHLMPQAPQILIKRLNRKPTDLRPEGDTAVQAHFLMGLYFNVHALAILSATGLPREEITAHEFIKMVARQDDRLEDRLCVVPETLPGYKIKRGAVAQIYGSFVTGRTFYKMPEDTRRNAAAVLSPA